MLGNFFQSRWFTILALTAMVFGGWKLMQIRPEKIEVENRLQNMSERIAELENSNAELNRLLDYFKSDAYLEKEAKLKLNVKRPDEEVVFIYPSEKNEEERPEKENFSWWPRLKAWILGIFQ